MGCIVNTTACKTWPRLRAACGALPWRWLLACCLAALVVCLPAPGGAADDLAAEPATVSEPGNDNDTLLLFVGEKLDVLNIATRREESAWQAPAVARVITREEILEKGLETLAEALALVPGFHMAQKEGGTQPYLRGIANGILFLYDTVPLGAYASKSFHELDREISLASVKRIEIVRGPGSVLWGPDAYAGVVNIVPMDGADLKGAETGVLYDEPGHTAGAFANLGGRSGSWDAFMSVSAKEGAEDDDAADVARFWGNLDRAVGPEDRYGHVTAGDARYLEASGRVAYNDRVSLSGRITDTARPYTLTDAAGRHAWREERQVSSGFVKLESKLDLGFDAGLRWMGSYSWLDPEYRIIDRTLRQEEDTFYGEMIYDRSLRAGKSLLTGGVSFRENRVQGAPVWDGYLPAYLAEENENLLPRLDQVDYESRLLSVFGQYVHSLGKVDLLAGLRFDDHDAYADALSYNAGLVWSPARQWRLKLLYGTAYRTPYSSQLRWQSEIEPEKIVNFSAQAAWRPSSRLDASVVLFTNRLEDHVREDPYAGLSNPNGQDIHGVEAALTWRPVARLEFSGNLTLMDNSGSDEVYRYNDYSYIDETTGAPVRHYTDLEYPYDIGAKRLFNLTGTWRPLDRLTTRATARYIGSRDLIHPRGDAVTRCAAVWLLDWSATVHDVVFKGADLTLAVTNLTDEDYSTPGTYSTIEGEPLAARAILRIRF